MYHIPVKIMVIPSSYAQQPAVGAQSIILDEIANKYFAVQI